MADGIKHLPPEEIGTEVKPRQLLPDEFQQGPVQWWTQPVCDVGKEDGLNLSTYAWQMLDSLNSEQEAVKWLLALNAVLYHGGSIESFAANYGASPLSLWDNGMNLSGPVHNIIKSAVDTIVNRIAINKPKTTAVSINGTWEERLRAEGMTDFSRGVNEQIQLYKKLPAVLRDACLFGDGILKPSVEDGRIKCQRILRGHIVIDEAEGYSGDPRTFFEYCTASRERLAAKFPLAADVVAKTQTVSDADYFRPPVQSAYSTVVQYVHCYRLPNRPGYAGPDGKGRHIVFTRAGILLDEEYNEAHEPYIRMGFSPATIGYWNEGLVASMRTGQLKVNRVDHVIDESMRRMSVGRWLVADGSDLVVEHLNNEIAAIVRFTGERPVKDNSDSVPEELIAERAFELATQPAMQGVSAMAEHGELPSGIKSGEGQKVALDVQTQRFSTLEQRYAQTVVDVDERNIGLVQTLTKDGMTYEVQTMDRFKQPRIVKFGDVNLNKDTFRIMLSPTNFMADSPEDRTDQAISLGQAGIFDQLEMLDAIDYPDIQSITAEKLAGLKFIKWMLYKMAREEDFFLTPEPDFDLVHGIPYCRAARYQLIQAGAPKHLQNKFQEWLNMAMALVPPPLGTKQPPAPPPMVGGPTPAALGMQPAPNTVPTVEGRGMRPPQTEMLPFHPMAQ